jgi:hypothetical protein
MEAIGSSRICQNLFRDYNAYIYEYIGDDDASTKKMLRHSWEDQVIAGTLDEVPRYKDGRKKPIMGAYQLSIPLSYGWPTKVIG